jgi:hypothetical protein
LKSANAVAKREGLANPENPDYPACLCKPPIFSDRFTFRRRVSDAFMHSRWHFSTTAYSARRSGLPSLPRVFPSHIRQHSKVWRKGAENVAHKASSKSGSPNRSSAKSMKKTTSRKSKATKVAANEVTVVAEDEVPIDRRRADRREETLDADGAKNGAPLERRKKVNRRRQIDPTTCERDYTDQEVEFMNALDDYKRKSGRMFPTCSEVLEVLRALGYVKLAAGELAALAVESSCAASAKPMPSDWSASNDESAEFESNAQLI